MQTKATGQPTLNTLANEKPVVLFADDTVWYRRELARHLTRECGLRVLHADHALEALRTLERRPDVSIVVADEKYPHGPSGSMLLEAVGNRWPHMKRILLSAYTTGEMISDGVERGYDVRDKSLSMGEIAEIVCAMANAA